MLEPRPLTTRQQDVLTAIARYNRVTGEPCPASYLARRFEIHHSTIQDCIYTLHQKGWLYAPNSPARARRWLSKTASNPAKGAVPQQSRESDST
jgi:DNA-binding MarR family transcriptional regulator